LGAARSRLLPDGSAFLPIMRAGARWDFHSAFAGARDFFAVTKGFGPRPLPAAISSIDRLEATEVFSSKMRFFFPSRANSSRCLIRSQLPLAYSAGYLFRDRRWRLQIRICLLVFFPIGPGYPCDHASFSRKPDHEIVKLTERLELARRPSLYAKAGCFFPDRIKTQRKLLGHFASAGF
jgi:hypothetical protein